MGRVCLSSLVGWVSFYGCGGFVLREGFYEWEEFVLSMGLY